MAQAGFLTEKKARPASALVVIAMHAAAIAALLLAKTEFQAPPEYTPIRITPVAPPPEPPPPMPPERQRQQPQSITRPPIPSPLPSPFRPPADPPAPIPDPGAMPSGEEVRGRPEPVPQPRPEPRPTPAPVRVAAQIVGGNLQPPYPASEQRAEREGTVVIRVTIGTDGRVVAARKLRATSDAFYEATERHARARWRFRPATVDGRPVESERTMTVQFELTG